MLFDSLPAAGDKPKPAIVFASNERRPAFLADYEKFPRVDGPVVQLIDHPSDRWSKLLLVLGRNDEDWSRLPRHWRWATTCSVATE